MNYIYALFSKHSSASGASPKIPNGAPFLGPVGARKPPNLPTPGTNPAGAHDHTRHIVLCPLLQRRN